MRPLVERLIGDPVVCLQDDTNMPNHGSTPACTRALTQRKVKFPWPRPYTGRVYYPCGFAIDTPYQATPTL